MSERIRSFVALNIPDDIGRAVGDFTGELRTNIKGVRWVRDGQVHLTLKFLGTLERAAVPQLGEALEQASSGVGVIPVTICGTGVFPQRGRPRVVWIDISEGAEALAALQGNIEEALAPLGYPKEQRPFRPHLTIGRVKELRDRAALTTALAGAADRRWGSFRVETIHLMRSELFPTGPRYSILREVRLRT